ncbi:MAG: hypothetical protein EZS28_028710 [Streblomastix strix]|uniref:DNA-directed DNA polymerase n=1 Tax=Streblomastix strix TaxID=222440 RepID=A0A5J4UZV6_9EUKA|nr:MAG: hypothetical protein EZS28_028710 [Streblomastix strix]
MSFSSSHLWFLIDDCHFIIDEVKSIMTFSKHLPFAPFVQHFSQQRIKAKLDKNKGLEQYSKISMNSSYGSDVRCLDSSKFHFVYGDTDSMMIAVAGNPNKDYNQGFSEIIIDQQFYDENFYKFFPDPSKGVYDEKKLLGVVYKHCGSSLIALAPKNYWLLEDLDKKHPQTVKLKGLNLKSNPQINKDAYEDNIRNGTVVQDKNISLRLHQRKMSLIEVFKNGITGTHTKMIVLPNQCCCPSKSQAQILDELLKRFDKTKKQIEIAEDSMKLSIQTILKQPRRLNLTEFVDEIQIQDSDSEIPVIIENADKIQYGGRTIQDWFDNYIAKELQKGKKRQNIRFQQEKTSQNSLHSRSKESQTIKFPFKSKVNAYEQVHGIKLEDNKKQSVVPDYQIKQLPQKFGRLYFSYDIGSWVIDIVFSMNPELV